jgi:hypothetical protein
MIAFSKLAYMDSVKTFSGTSLSPQKAAYAYNTASNANNSSTTSSSTSSITSPSTCGYKGLVVNETGIDGIVFKITSKGGFEKSYFVGANQTIADDLPEGNYSVTAYNGSNIIYSERMRVNSSLTKNFKGAEVYWCSYCKYVYR